MLARVFSCFRKCCPTRYELADDERLVYQRGEDMLIETGSGFISTLGGTAVRITHVRHTNEEGVTIPMDSRLAAATGAIPVAEQLGVSNVR